MKIKILVALILSVLTGATYAAQGFMAVANVTKIHGKAMINKVAVKEGAEVADHMTIVIPKANDYIDVKFQNGHVIRFVGATVKVEDITPKSAVFNVEKGRVFAAIKPMTQNEFFTIKTARGTFQADNSRLWLEETKKDTYVIVADGKVAAKTKKGEVVVNKSEDIRLAKPTAELKTTLAAESMLQKSNTTFKEMGAL
jgi:uncharacterized protein YaiI (UPF0178 family)